MLVELHVRGLGVIEDARVVLAEGLTALTGETGAGKTLLVDALDLVLGGKPRRGLVPPGGAALVEAVFLDKGEEVILAREVPADGRARAWIDGRMSSVASLEERARGLCDILGQHEHQTLLSPGSVRVALDLWAGLDDAELRAARRELGGLLDEQRHLGGDSTAVARELSLLRHEVAEIQHGALGADDEMEALLAEVHLLESAQDLRLLLSHGVEALDETDQGPRRALSALVVALEEHPGLEETRQVVVGALVNLDEAASELRRSFDRIEEDPSRLDAVNERLRLLGDLCRRYGPTIAEVKAKGNELAERLATFEAAEGRRDGLAELLVLARGRVDRLDAEFLAARRAAAPAMAAQIQERLASLALERAVLELHCEGPAGEDVELLFSANPGLVPQPVSKVASGGELARLMLALHLSMPGGPGTMIFDEVDAGVGGATAVTLAAALRDLSRSQQVVVVTHLAQVAAAADVQVVVTKTTGEGSTTATAVRAEDEDRVTEVARMLSGHPDSSAAREHAAELLNSFTVT